MSRTRHKSCFGVATADMFITSEHQPPDLVVARSGHGLTAETVVVALEVRSGYHRLRRSNCGGARADALACIGVVLVAHARATAIETDVLQIQAEISSDDTGQKRRTSPI